MKFTNVTLARKVTICQIHDDSISQNEFHMVYNVCTKIHAFIKKCTIQSLSLNLLLYYNYHLAASCQMVAYLIDYTLHVHKTYNLLRGTENLLSIAFSSIYLSTGDL